LSHGSYESISILLEQGEMKVEVFGKSQLVRKEVILKFSLFRKEAIFISPLFSKEGVRGSSFYFFFF